jgi:hypothetical protein
LLLVEFWHHSYKIVSMKVLLSRILFLLFVINLPTVFVAPKFHINIDMYFVRATVLQNLICVSFLLLYLCVVCTVPQIWVILFLMS